MAARKKVQARPASIKPSDADPQSWLYLLPPSSPGGLVFGNLRKEYGGRSNSAAEFGWRKAHPTMPGTQAERLTWAPTAERVEVLLPANADDALLEPSELLAQVDRHAVDRQPTLLTYTTLPLPDAARLHSAWERARGFGRRVAEERQLAILLVLHNPGAVGAPFPLHAHALIIPRQISGLGLRSGVYDEELVHDTGQTILEAIWAEMTP